MPALYLVIVLLLVVVVTDCLVRWSRGLLRPPTAPAASPAPAALL